MIIIEASRRVSKRAVQRIRAAFMEWDTVIYKRLDVEPPAEDVYRIIKQGRTYVLAIEDPSLG